MRSRSNSSRRANPSKSTRSPGKDPERSPASPVLAFPLIVRYDVAGLLLLGEKRDAERVDGLELAAVQALVVAAGLAYDHLDALEQQHVADDLRRALDEARAESATLRGLLGREPSGV